MYSDEFQLVAGLISPTRTHRIRSHLGNGTRQSHVPAPLRNLDPNLPDGMPRLLLLVRLGEIIQ